MSKDLNCSIARFWSKLSDLIKSKSARQREVFENELWWLNGFYKYLFHELPHSHFILLERDSDSWFNSMLSHSNGQTFMNTHLHLNIYRREVEMKDHPDILSNSYTKKLDNLLKIEESHREHYKRIYEVRNYEVKLFFEKHRPERLFKGNLSEPEIWQKMGDFFKIKVSLYEC